MATESEARLTGHTRSVVVTSLLSLSGVAAGIITAFLAGGPTDRIGLMVVAGAMLINLGILQAIGVDISEFGPKEYLYNAFMTFALWYVTWGVFLTSEVSL